jgi:hypothetical protein
MQFHKFKIEQIKTNDFIMIIGNRDSGKSLLIKNILYQFSENKEDFKPFGYIISPDKKGIYDDIIPSILREYELTDKLLNKIYQKYKNYEKRMEKGIHENTSSFLILDDCIFYEEKELFQNLKKIIKKKNLFHLFSILSFQYPLCTKSNSLNEYIDYLFISKIKFKEDLEKIYKLYLSFIPSFEIFYNIYQQCIVNDFEFLIFQLNLLNINEWYKHIYWFKCDLVDNFNFKLCNEYYWLKNQKNQINLINNEYNQDIEDKIDSSKENYRKYFRKKEDIMMQFLNEQNLSKKEKKEYSEYEKNEIQKIKDKKRIEKTIHQIYKLGKNN